MTKHYKKANDRRMVREKITVLQEFIDLTNLMEPADNIPPPELLTEHPTETIESDDPSYPIRIMKVVFPDHHRSFFDAFYKEFEKTIFWKVWVYGGSIPAQDILSEFKQIYSGNEGELHNKSNMTILPSIEMYELYFSVRATLAGIFERKIFYIPVARYIGVDYEDQIFSRVGASDTKEAALDLFARTLEGLPANRLRRCPICFKFFWAERKDQSTCSKQHANALRVRKFRERYEKQVKAKLGQNVKINRRNKRRG